MSPASTAAPLIQPEKRQHFLPLAAFLFTLLSVVFWFATRMPGGPIDLFERGAWLGPASDMLAGKVPYRQTFPVHGFLSDGGMDALLFSLLGPFFSTSLNAHHLLAALFQPALFLIAASATRSPGLALLAVPLNVGFATALVADRPVIPLLSLAAFLYALDDERRPAPAALAGVLAGLGFLYALEFGSFVLIAQLSTVALWILARKGVTPPFPSVFYLGGLGAVLVPFFIYLGSGNALIPFFRTSFLDLPLSIHAVWGWAFPTPLELIAAGLRGESYRIAGLSIGLGIVKRLYLAPLLGTLGIVFALWLLRRRVSTALAARVFVLSVACLLFFRYVIARLHLEVGNALTGPLVFVLVAGLPGMAPELGQRRRYRMLALGIGLVCALAMNSPARTAVVLRNAAGYRHRQSETSGLVSLSVPRGKGVLVPKLEAAEVEALFAFVSRSVDPECEMLDLTNRPGLYFFLQRTNPTRFYQVPLMAPFQEEVVRDLERSPPSVVLLEGNGPLDNMDGVSNSRRIPLVWAHVQKHYPLRARVGHTVFALPNSFLALASNAPSITPLEGITENSR